MPTYWKLDRALREHRIANPLQLAERAHIGYPAATRIWKAHTTGAKLERFNFDTLDKLAVLFGVEPLSLLTDKPARKAKPPRPPGKPALPKR